MFTIPALYDRVVQMRGLFRTYLQGTDAWLPVNNIGPTAKVIGIGLHELDGRMDYIQNQAFVSTAEDEFLLRHGAEFGMAPWPASSAAGTTVVAATTDTIISAGATLLRSDGLVINVPAGATIPAGWTADISVVAAETGSAGITLAGTTLTVQGGVTGTATFTVDNAGLANGSDGEDPEAFRARVLFRKRNPPHGGSAPDYVIWGTAVPGVTRVFVEPLWSGAGTIRLFPVCDTASAGPIPSAAVVAQVAAAYAIVQPGDADVTVTAPQPLPINITITGLVPSSTAVKEAVLAELRDMVTRLGQVAGGAAPNAGMPYLAVPQTFSRSWIWQAVANASGEQRHSITAPASDPTVPAGYLPVLGSVLFN